MQADYIRAGQQLFQVCVPAAVRLQTFILIPVKGQFVLYLTAEHLYWPAFHINVQNFLGAQGNIRADENTQGSGIQEHILRMAEQNYGIFNAIETPFITADIITQLPEVTRLTAASVFRR